MALNLIIQALEKFGDGFEFEHLCNDIMHIHYPGFKPGGNVHDLGVDGLLVLDEQEDVRLYFKMSSIKGSPKTFIYQYSIQETWKAKIKNTLKKLDKNKIEYDQLIYVTNQHPTQTEVISFQRDSQKDYQKVVEIHSQEFLRIYLEDQANSHLVEKYFASYFAQLKRWDIETTIFANVPLTERNKRRALVLLSACVRSPEGQEVKENAAKEIILGCIYGEGSKSECSRDDILNMLLNTYGDKKLLSDDFLDTILNELTTSDCIKKTQNGFHLTDGEFSRIEAKIGRSYEEDRTFYKPLMDELDQFESFNAQQKKQIQMVIAKGIGIIFERKGIEIANALCNRCQTSSLNDYPEINIIAREVTSDLDFLAKESTIKILQRLFTNPTTFEAEYLFGIAESYLVYASFNLDVNARLLESKSIQENILILDTDILLQALVGEDDRHVLYQKMLKATKNLSVTMYTLPQMIHEFVYKIKRSNEDYNYMNRPASLTSDLLDELGIVFKNYFSKAVNTRKTWDQFIASLIGSSRNEKAQEKFVEDRFETEYGVQTKDFSSDITLDLNEIKIFAKEIIEIRQSHQTYKHDDLYETDALMALTVDKLQEKHSKLHFWLLSNDSYLSRAWHKHTNNQLVPLFPPQLWFQYITNHPSSKSKPVDFAVLMKSLNVSPARPKVPRNLILTLIRFGVNINNFTTEALEELNKRLYVQWVWKKVLTKRSSEITDDEINELGKSLDKVLKGIEEEIAPDRFELKTKIRNDELTIKELISEKMKIETELEIYRKKEKGRVKYLKRIKRNKTVKKKR